MALSRAVSGWVNSGTTEVINGTDGAPQTVPIYTAQYNGEWLYTNAAGGTSVIAAATATQAEAEAARDAWLAAGGTA